VRKVIEGGGGNWGNTGRMPSHAALTEKEVRKMVEHIVSRNRKKDGVQSLPLNGTVSLTAHESSAEERRYVLSASYTDRGSDGIRSFTGTDRVVLRRPLLEAEDYDRARDAAKRNMYVDRIRHGSYIAFDSVDVTGLSRVTYRVERKEVEGRIEVHRGGPAGPLLSEVTIEGTGTTVDWRTELYTTSHRWTTVDAPLTPTDGVYDLYFVFKNASAKEDALFNLDRIRFHGSVSQ
jgi:cytochrome c